MAIWHEDQWKSGDPAIDTEHQKLHQMISSMVAVIRNDAGLGLAAEAVDVLHERMRVHFRMEEHLAARIGPEAAAHLKKDHQRLLNLLPPVRQAIEASDLDLACQRIELFRQELDTHDRQVDIPLFQRS